MADIQQQTQQCTTAATSTRSRNRKNKNRAAADAVPADAAAATTAAQSAEAAELQTQALPLDDKSKLITGAVNVAVSKRLRNLKNRLTKLEAYSAIPPKDLEKDQVEALLKKGEVAASVKELEEVVKQLSQAEIDEDASNKDKARCAKMTEDLKVTIAVTEAQNVARENLKKTLELTYALATLSPNLSSINVRLSESQFNALSDLRSLVLGAYPTGDTKTFFDSAEHVLSQYLCASASEFSRGVTYAELNILIHSIVNPPPVPKFGISAASVVDNAPPGTFEEPTVTAVRSQTPTMGRNISFFAQE
ncbi:UNVERIFIED_CONTAM: hypothetical protein HDU68_007693 [Siphonaria sp. JEL0065]|nr:hypothetical protein HDU68_007693 [Siphonaria sp. JEL0065]